ncbi:hypothetical protein SARC_06272 [Sphaeroforma arctica JP610]|uniref:Uncharacterized protein n=1 Tax=Sphaeroforma arctica JP610 TaxID=667725 RepID=A0A0L0FZL4_9EUKA|nr:hypothetical protein SARC_06272 [Sphaeroforma arctica JP610]KNC81408.1 hypothetical protein SARC_06272 [Sphaeroforma arctica JP610]|eukprot:XP_014155310.1 hypothetical protein SARC_06272 [Sphaeroforma arctica JP610]
MNVYIIFIRVFGDAPIINVIDLSLKNSTMLKSIRWREHGLEPPARLQWRENTRRSFAAELSTNFEFERVHSAAVTSIDIDVSEARYLLSASTNGAVAIHDVMDAKPEPLSYHDAQPAQHTPRPAIAPVIAKLSDAHAFSIGRAQWYPVDTGLFTTSGFDHLLKVWDTNAMECVTTFDLKDRVFTHALPTNATGHCLMATATAGSSIRLCDMRSGGYTHTLQGHNDSVLSVVWSPRDQYTLVSGGRDHRLLMWDIRSAKSLLGALDQYNSSGSSDATGRHTAHNGGVNAVTFTPDALYILSSGRDNRMRLWDQFTGLNTLNNYAAIENTSRTTAQVAVSLHSERPIVYHPTGHDIALYELYTAKRVHTLTGHFGRVNTIACHPSEPLVYSGGHDHEILCWSPGTDERRRRAALVDDKGTFSEHKTADASDFQLDVGGETRRPELDTWSDED